MVKDPLVALGLQFQPIAVANWLYAMNSSQRSIYYPHVEQWAVLGTPMKTDMFSEPIHSFEDGFFLTAQAEEAC